MRSLGSNHLHVYIVEGQLNKYENLNLKIKEVEGSSALA